jgi:hypothetical protein
MDPKRWKPTHLNCPQWAPTEEGMTDFVRGQRDLLYCANQGKRDECSTCSAHECCGFGDGHRPSIKFTKGYSSPL